MSPLPEGFGIKLVAVQLKKRRRLDYAMVSPSHPSGIRLPPSAGALLAALIYRYGKPVYRTDLIDSVYGEDEDGGPLSCEKIIDVFICKARYSLRLAGVDFDYKGNHGYRGEGTLTLFNLRECAPYEATRKRKESGWAKCREQAAAARIARKAEQFAQAKAKTRETAVEAMASASKGSPVDTKLMQAKQAFREHNRPLPDLWAKPARAEAWEARKGERS